MATEKTFSLGEVDGTLEKPFVLKFARSGSTGPAGKTNVFEDTCATLAGIEPSALPSGETVGTTGYPGETADTTFQV